MTFLGGYTYDPGVSEEKQMECYRYLLDHWGEFTLTFEKRLIVDQDQAVGHLMAETMKSGKSSLPLEAFLGRKEEIVLIFTWKKGGDRYARIPVSRKMVELCMTDMNKVPQLAKWYVEQLLTDLTLRRL